MAHRPRVAIAHDYLTQRGGAERVVLSLLKAFPGAAVHTTLYEPDATYPEFKDVHVITSGLNRVPAFRRDHRIALPALPFAANEMRVDADVVVASSTGWAHGFPTPGRKLVYCHSPARYLYLTEEYLGSPLLRTKRGLGLGLIRQPLIAWDQRAARTVDRYLCNSTVVQQRIHDVYGLPAKVVPPPAGVNPDGPQSPVEAILPWAAHGGYLVVSRLMPYKNVHHVIEAFRELDAKLVIVGRGPQRDELAASLPANVRMLEGLSDAQLRWTYSNARSLIAPSFEDFGLTPLEAGAFGKPCLALRGGGYLDTIREGINGSFFDQPTAPAIRAAVRADLGRRWDRAPLDAWVAQFAETRFIETMRGEADALLSR